LRAWQRKELEWQRDRERADAERNASYKRAQELLRENKLRELRAVWHENVRDVIAELENEVRNVCEPATTSFSGAENTFQF
jgi:hypothetical protein